MVGVYVHPGDFGVGPSWMAPGMVLREAGGADPEPPPYTRAAIPGRWVLRAPLAEGDPRREPPPAPHWCEQGPFLVGPWGWIPPHVLPETGESVSGAWDIFIAGSRYPDAPEFLPPQGVWWSGSGYAPKTPPAWDGTPPWIPGFARHTGAPWNYAVSDLRYPSVSPWLWIPPRPALGPQLPGADFSAQASVTTRRTVGVGGSRWSFLATWDSPPSGSGSPPAPVTRGTLREMAAAIAAVEAPHFAPGAMGTYEKRVLAEVIAGLPLVDGGGALASLVGCGFGLSAGAASLLDTELPVLTLVPRAAPRPFLDLPARDPLRSPAGTWRARARSGGQFSGASIGEVARAAGVSTGALFGAFIRSAEVELLPVA